MPHANEQEVARLREAMRDETEHTMLGPGNVGPWTKESVKGLGIASVMLGIGGAVLFLPLALMPVFADVSVALRLLVAALVGMFAGLTVAHVWGPGLAQRRHGVEERLPDTPGDRGRESDDVVDLTDDRHRTAGR